MQINVELRREEKKKQSCTFVSFVQCMYENQCHLKTVTFSFYNGQNGLGLAKWKKVFGERRIQSQPIKTCNIMCSEASRRKTNCPK